MLLDCGEQRQVGLAGDLCAGDEDEAYLGRLIVRVTQGLYFTIPCYCKVAQLAKE